MKVNWGLPPTALVPFSPEAAAIVRVYRTCLSKERAYIQEVIRPKV